MNVEYTSPELQKKKRGRWLLPLVVLFVMTAVILVVLKGRGQAIDYEPNVSAGTMPGKTAEDIRRELQAAQDEAVISYTVNSNPIFPDGASMGDWRMDCPGGNFNKLRFVVTRDSTGGVLYDSGPMEQGSFIMEDYLQTDTPLAKGDYDCTVSVDVLDPETEQIKGQVAVKIVVTVQR